MKITNGDTPTDAQLMASDFSHAFAYGLSPEGVFDRIPEKEWPAEIEKMHNEEEEWWKGDDVESELLVELPFWLMIPDGTLQIKYLETLIPATISSNLIEVASGPISSSSRTTVEFIGTNDALSDLDLDAVVPNRMPIFRHMKSSVIFDVTIKKDVFNAWKTRHTLQKEDHSGARNLNRTIQYCQSLAFSHLPFLNRLISSYRSVSLDPWAFEVSECDVPVWHLRRGSELVRIGLMPYWDNVHFPSVRQGKDSVPFFAASLESLQSQISDGVAPGKLELLDAFSLQYRGKYEDAVRSAVTAIEVALEAQYKQELLLKGRTEEEADSALSETRNNFFDRLARYEKLSRRRLPGPVLSVIPYINGIRFREELESARALRHKVVHEGQRIDIFSRGAMLRVIETMTWCFEWLTTNDEHRPGDNRNYVFFSMLRGTRRYPFEYVSEGVHVLPLPWANGGSRPPMSTELYQQQYDASITPEEADIELFTRMSFWRLELNCTEGAPTETGVAIIAPRFIVDDVTGKLIVYCLEVDGELEFDLANRVATSVLAFNRKQVRQFHSVCILQHQRHLAPELREIGTAMSAPIADLFLQCGITIITTVDLKLLIDGMNNFGWDAEMITNLLRTPGRQGINPPDCHRVGLFNQFYETPKAASIQLDANEVLKVGDVIVVRFPTGYYQTVVQTLQVNRNPVGEAVGPVKVGIGDAVNLSLLRRSSEIYVRRLKGNSTVQTPIVFAHDGDGI